MYGYDDFKDIDRRMKEIEEATRLARSPGFVDNIKRTIDKDFSIHETATQRADEAAAMLREESAGGVLWEDLARRQQDFDRIRAQVEALPDVSDRALSGASINALPEVNVAALSGLNADTLVSAERLATQALKAYSAPNFGDLLPKNFDQFQDLIGRATSLAAAPSTQQLLRSADEVMAAAPGVTVEERPLDPVDLDDLPDIPDLNWMLQLDRDTLIFWCRFLFDLTLVLSSAFGVQVALSDGDVDTEDLPAVLTSLNVMLLFALRALEKKNRN